MTSRFISFAAALVFASHASASEVCHFTGTTDYSGKIAVTATTKTDPADGATTVDVALRFEGRSMPFVHVTYLMEEISRWHSGALQRLAVNSRYLVNSHIVRQQWDVFDRSKNGLDAYRVQGKTLTAFRRDHPGFVQHWDVARFGQPWLQDYRFAAPERRADLDLPAQSAQHQSAQHALRSPLALAFYWTEHLPRNGEEVDVFLPSFKKDKQVDFAISPVEPPKNASELWQAAIYHPALGTSRPSTAEAWVSNGHLLQLAFTVRSSSRTARGIIREEGCETTADNPSP
jgi:hypothetical protein